MAPKSYADLKAQVEELLKDQDALKQEIKRLSAIPAGEVGDELKLANQAREKAEGEVVELKTHIASLPVLPGAEAGEELKAALDAKANAEAEITVLKQEIERLLATVNSQSEGHSQAVILAKPYAFYDEDGVLRSWDAGEVTNEDHIALLRERGVL